MSSHKKQPLTKFGEDQKKFEGRNHVFNDIFPDRLNTETYTETDTKRTKSTEMDTETTGTDHN